MPLFLTEITLDDRSPEIPDVLRTIRSVAEDNGAEFIEAQVTADRIRIFVILEANESGSVRDALVAAGLRAEGFDPVRLVGADLDEIKRERPSSGYLVEWDIPSGITMDTYLARKKEKSPLYAQVPETTFQRTYVREDMVKCLCFYDAPDEAAVVRAREVVSTPIDRLHRLDESLVPSDD